MLVPYIIENGNILKIMKNILKDYPDAI